MLNKQGPGKIDWTDWTWNPISGCLHGCEYCYMRRMEKRFPDIMNPDFKMHYVKRFTRVKKVLPGDKIFVGSSGDMWGSWVFALHIMSVLETISMRPDVTFQFLTKNPARYHNWGFGDNCWLGTTVDGTKRTARNIEILIDSVSASNMRFISFEPLLAPVRVPAEQWKELDWIIIGANSNKGAEKPPRIWAANLEYDAQKHGVPVWVKDNYGYPKPLCLKKFPKGFKRNER